MATKLIELSDGALVEIEIPGDQMEKVSGGLAEKVDANFTQINPTLVKVCKGVMAAWKELNKDMSVQEAEIEFGLSFEGEGNIYVTKAKAGANLTIKMTLKPKPESQQ